MIVENDESNVYFTEEDDYASDIDDDNELNCPAYDATNEEERREHIKEHLCATYKQFMYTKHVVTH